MAKPQLILYRKLWVTAIKNEVVSLGESKKKRCAEGVTLKEAADKRPQKSVVHFAQQD